MHGSQKRIKRPTREHRRIKSKMHADDDKYCPVCHCRSPDVKIYGMCSKCIADTGEWHLYFSG